MLLLTGINLGERQKELNAKVNEAALNNVDFDQVKDENEQSDVDKLYKIDLASKYMNIEYIIEVLKSGDNLYISRALKCSWIYADEFSNIINVDNLHHNVFPFMSLKMKKKLLTTVSKYIRNEDRTLAFYKYCMETKLTNIAMKFVIFTSDAFKLQIIKEDSNKLHELTYKSDFKNFIGCSFTLADAYLCMLNSESSKLNFFNQISYLYFVSDTKYLDMLEKYVNVCVMSNINLGLRISKAILTKHKQRVLKKPSLYINLLNKALVAKYSTVDNAKTYTISLLPSEVSHFWAQKFGNSYEHLLNILPADERFIFIKKVFNDKYPGQAFEMDHQFYKQQYYKFMTVQEKEKWALEQIASQKELLGLGKDYIWYKHVNFDIAFEEIKKLVTITHDNNKRAEMNNILIESAKSQRDLEKLFKHYYDRHNNEQRYTKENFIDCVTHTHNVYDFDKDCWTAFNKIFQNLEVYSMLDYTNSKGEFKIIALIYHIVNKIEVHDALKLYISTNMYFFTLKLNTDKLTKEQQDMVFEYLFDFYMIKIKEFDSVPYEKEVKYKLRKYIHFILDLLHQYDRNKEDIPEVVTKLMKLDWDEYNCHKLHYEQPKKLTEEDLIRNLKKDAKLLVENIPMVKKSIEISYRFNMAQLLKKLRVYFPNDISKEYIKFFNELLTTETQLYPKVAQAAVYGIFQLADHSFKIDFMTKHAPIQSKINRSEMDQRLLRIQEAICATACYSRPPVPLKNMLLYVKGDYVSSSLPLFNYYLANLPLPMCIEFVTAILNTPVSIQKHGLRLAFACFNAENLKKLVLYIWKKTKNISLRMIIYKALHNKIVTEDQNAQTALFETLSTLTLELHQDDDKEVFELLTSARGLPRHFVSDYINAAWTAVSALPDNSINLQRKSAVIEYMCRNIREIRQDTVRPIVKEFINDVFEREHFSGSSLEATYLIQKKWNLTASHIIYLQNPDDLETKLELTKYILNQCLNKYSLVHEEKYIMRSLCVEFIHNILLLSYSQDVPIETYAKYNEYLNVLFKNILEILIDSFPVEDVYLIVWEMRMDFLTRQAVAESKIKLPDINEDDEKIKIVRDIIFIYAKEMGNLIRECIEKEMYLTSFIPQIQRNVYENACTITNAISFDIRAEDVLVITSLALMDFKRTEMYLFALGIVPSDYDRHYNEDYKSVLNELKLLDNIEIRCKLYDKFVNSDYRSRAFLQLQ